MNVIFVETAIERLRNFLKQNNQKIQIETLTPDASTREYFRVEWNGQPAIACVYGESFKAVEHSYLDVTALFRANNLPVAEIYAFDESLGIVIQEDFGDVILRDFLQQSDEPTCDELLNRSIGLIARIQAATPDAYARNSIASRLKFDEEKLLWELNFFKTHYFKTLRRTELSDADEQTLNEEFCAIAAELAARAEVLCHRDFHTANLMLDKAKRLRIIDHQDARIGTTSYDLVSLLLDRVTETPAKIWLDDKKNYFLNERLRCGLEPLDGTDFEKEFCLQTVQRGLKAVGTFSFQSVNRGKTYFVPFIAPTLLTVLQACRQLEKFSHLQSIIERQLNS